MRKDKEEVLEEVIKENLIIEAEEENNVIELEKLTEEESSEVKQEGKTYSKSAILTVCALSYLVIFLPIFFFRKEPFALFHYNQAIVLWITIIVLMLAVAFVPAINMVAIPLVIMFHILGIIVGMNYSFRGKAKPLPLIGKIKIIQWDKIK